jgi:hypothetical protein
MDEYNAVDIVLRKNLFNYPDPGAKGENIPKIQWIAQPDNAGMTSALSFIENVSVQRRQMEAADGASVCGYNSVSAGP